MKKTDLIIISISFYILSITLKINNFITATYISLIASLSILLFLIYLMKIEINGAFIPNIMFCIALALSLKSVMYLYPIALFVIIYNLPNNCIRFLTITVLLPIAITLIIMIVISILLNLNIGSFLIEIISLCFTFIYNFIIHNLLSDICLSSTK